MTRQMPACAAVAALLLCAGCGDGAQSPAGPSPPPSPDPGGVAVLAGAGDIGVCGTPGAEATAKLLDGIDGTVFTAGDNAYHSGTADEFRNCYDPTWGRHKARTSPAAGNHDYESAGAAPYYAYFGARAGNPGQGYYSFQAGSWHVISLNSNIPAGYGSAQMGWLQVDLASHPSDCTAVIWHHPRFSSSEHGSQLVMRDAWQTLQQAGADFVVSGHDHVYERFARLDANGQYLPSGIRQFVVGTGGAPPYSLGPAAPGSEVRATGIWGVIRLTLQPGSYQWEFIPVAGQSFRDSGTDTCK